jgi:hypothetical protein
MSHQSQSQTFYLDQYVSFNVCVRARACISYKVLNRLALPRKKVAVLNLNWILSLAVFFKYSINIDLRYLDGLMMPETSLRMLILVSRGLLLTIFLKPCSWDSLLILLETIYAYFILKIKYWSWTRQNFFPSYNDDPFWTVKRRPRIWNNRLTEKPTYRQEARNGVP